MASAALQSFLVIMALLGAMLFVRLLTGTKARTRPAAAAQPPRVLPAPGAAGLLPAPPPVRGVLDVSAAPIAQPSERRGRRLSLVEARNGIVLATILGACRAHRVEEPW
jgi:uncharacterized membrane protein